jgi:hypothetical protein
VMDRVFGDFGSDMGDDDDFEDDEEFW